MFKARTSLYLGICILIMLFQTHPAFSETESGSADVTTLAIIDTKVGNGTTAISDAETRDVVEVHYTGWLYDADATDHKGKKYNSTVDRGKPITFKLGTGNPIKGLDQGIAGMKVGGKRTLIIPPKLAYGSAGRGIIPPNTPLIVDVELLNVIIKEE